MQDDLYGAVECVDQFSPICASANGDRILTDCSNDMIFGACNYLNDEIEFNNCFATGVRTCKNLELINMNPDRLANDLSCIKTVDVCKEVDGADKFYDLVAGRCKLCETLG